MVRIDTQPVRKQIPLDAGERSDALRVARQPAVAAWHRLPVSKQAVHRQPDVAELTSHPGCTADHLTRLNHATAKSGPNDHRDGGTAGCELGAKMLVVRIQCGCV